MNHRALHILLGAVLSIGFACAGCNRDVRLAGESVPENVTVSSVTMYNLELDGQADPQMVAYAALRAIADDFRARSDAERQEALDKEFQLCAPEAISSRNRTNLSRDEWVFNVVHRWTPTVSHYISQFPSSFEEAKGRMVVRGRDLRSRHTDDATECAVLMEVADPSGQPEAQVVLVVWMAKEAGHWRVTHLGFDGERRSIR